MQGPRLPSHSVRIALQELPRSSQATTSTKRLKAPKMEEGMNSYSSASVGTGSKDLALDSGKESVKGSVRSFRRTKNTLRRHLKFLGPGIVAAIAYVDPGNYATDLQAGASYGYAHLFVVLLSGIFAVFLQILACRLGCVSGKDLAQHCREAFHDRPSRTKFWRWAVLYPLYFVAEAGIIFTDLAELLGSAIALNLLIPAIPIWGGVLLTTADVFVVLLLFNNYGNGTANNVMRIFELFLALLVLVVLVAFIVLLARIGPNWGDVFHGYLPGPGVVNNGGLYVAVGIIGATVMPHALFLGSKIATMDRLGPSAATPHQKHSPALTAASSSDALNISPANPDYLPRSPLTPRSAASCCDSTAPVRTAEWCRLHISHASADIACSLLTIAITVNSAILILAGAAFFYSTGGSVDAGDLQSAYRLLQERVGAATAYMFAIALLMSGQAAGITVTLAGQCVSEGFLEWKTSPFVRRVITRLIGIVPSVIVAVSAGQKGINTLLVASQVALSIVLPFVIGPLLLFTTSPATMSADSASGPISKWSSAAVHQGHRARRLLRRIRSVTSMLFTRPSSPGKVSFANPPIVAAFGLCIFILIIIANVYAIVQLAIDPSAA